VLVFKVIRSYCQLIGRSIGRGAVATALALALAVPGTAVGGTPLTAASSLSSMPITYPLWSGSTLTYWNSTARPTDIAILTPPSLNLLGTVSSGIINATFDSWATAQQRIPSLTTPVGIVTYDAEHWAATPVSEQNNLVATTKTFASYVHQRGLKFGIAFDRSFDDQYASQVAPVADYYLVQGQAIETNPAQFASWVGPIVSTIRAANPGIKVFVQVGTAKGTPQQMLAAIQTVSNNIDGIAIWADASQLSQLQQFVVLVRP
jgi:hypothetical protein